VRVSADQRQLWVHDAQLAPCLQLTAPSAAQGLTPSTIFLTGATGFLGGHLLAELLQTTTAQLYCLMRGSQVNDLLTILLKGCILLGAYPALAIDVPMVPVDYIARAVGYLSQQPASFGKAFHFFNAPAIAWEELWLIIQRFIGYRSLPRWSRGSWSFLHEPIRFCDGDAAYLSL